MQITCPFEVNRNEITLHIPDGAITGLGLADNSVLQRHMTDDSIGSDELLAAAIESVHLATDSITEEKVATNAINSAALIDAIITSAKLANLAVDTEHMALLAIEAGQLAGNAVESTKIKALAVGQAAIALLAVGQAQIANAAILEAKIDSAAITTVKIFNLAVSTGKIANLAVVDAKIGDIAANKITATGTITGSTLRTAASGTRFEVSHIDGEGHYFGDRGDGTIVELATIGITVAAGDFVIGNFGAVDSTHIAVRAYSDKHSAIYAVGGTIFETYSGEPAMHVRAEGAAGFTPDDHPVAIYAQAFQGYALRVQSSATAPGSICLGRQSSQGSGSPNTNVDALFGTLFVNNAGTLYICTSYPSGTTWVVVGTQS